MTLRWTAGVRREVLPNGLTLLVHRDPTAPAVAVVSLVRAGFFDEPDHQVGVSHVLEHMLFKGTPTRRVGEIARETKAAGGYLNAATSYDRTAYYTVLPAMSLPVALDLQSDALRRSLIDPEELRRELVVIIEEAKRKLDSPGAVTAETLNAVLFDRHRIRRWRIGTESHLAALPHQEVQAYYRSRYVPGRTIVAMAGELDPDTALAMARDYFGSWPAAEAVLDPSPVEPEHREVRLRILTGDVRRAHLMAGWRGVPARHPDAPALDVAAAVLGTGRASWLFRTLRAPGVVVSAGAGHFSTSEVGVFSLGAELDPARLDATLAGLASGVARLQSEGPSEEDLARVRIILEARFARGLESTEGRASALAGAEAQGGFQLLDDDYERLLAVTPDQVRRASREWLGPDAVGVVAYLPEGAAHGLSIERIAGHFRSAPSAVTTPIVPPRVEPAPPRPVRGTVTSGVLHVALAGVDLLIGRKPGVPLVSLGVYRRRTMPESHSSAGLGALAVRSAIRGAGPFDADQLALGFERLGGTLTPLVTSDWFGYGASVLASAAVEAAVLLDHVLCRPRLEAAEIERERTTLADEAVQAADDMVRFPMQLSLSGAFGQSGYGLPVQGLPESVPELSPGMVKAWHACELAQGRTTVVAVGDVDPDTLAGRLAGVFGEGPPRMAWVDPEALTRPVAAGPVMTVVERARKQTALAMFYPGPARRDPARHAAVVWAALSGGLGGRLFTALRDTRSLAYTVMASSWQRAAAGGLLLYLATSPGREAEARAALLEELGRFRNEDCHAGELSRSIGYLTGQSQVRRQTGSALAGEIADAWLIGEGLVEVAEPTAGIRAVTAAAVRALAGSYLQEGARAEGVVRGTAEERPEYVSGQPARERA